ncbi:MAG: SufD family Fe-S cluster assembly protein [Candidatus Buchananbacteria bacterium]|nr:SufD family Fe-S cluster assembly protein [Candidatus Buchananbacteria bacterium]
MRKPSVQQLIKKQTGLMPGADQIFEIKAKPGAVVYLASLNLDFNKEIFLAVSNKNITIIDDHGLVTKKSRALRLNILTGFDSNVDYVITSPGVDSYQAFYQFYPGEDASLNCYALGKFQDENYHLTLAINQHSSGSIGNIICAFDFKNQSRTSVSLINNHQGRDTVGDIKFRGLGRDAAKALIEGMISIGKKGSNTNSYLQQDVLLVSPTASIDAKPNLEILNNEVKASHGATLASFDPSVLFYLESRGLDERQAQQLIINGFFNSLIAKVDNKIIIKQFKEFWPTV